MQCAFDGRAMGSPDESVDNDSGLCANTKFYANTLPCYPR